jgi:hypothetical protein
MNIRGGADTLKFNLHIIRLTKKGCEFNQKRCEFKIFPELWTIWFIQEKNLKNNSFTEWASCCVTTTIGWLLEIEIKPKRSSS